MKVIVVFSIIIEDNNNEFQSLIANQYTDRVFQMHIEIQLKRCIYTYKSL